MRGLLILLLLIVIASVLIYIDYANKKLIQQVTPLNRGEKSERKVILRLIKSGINPKAIFHDLYIRKANGEYTQVDLAVATKCGIVVFEVKDYGGWIFGSEQCKYWTQILAYGKERHRFYNPFMQNEGHIRAIRHTLPNNPGIPIYSVVVFDGDCELKDVTYYSENTIIVYANQIKKLMHEILLREPADYGDKYEVMRVFTEAVANGNNPYIVAAQRYSANRYSQHKPQSTYYYSSNPFVFINNSFRKISNPFRNKFR